MTNPADQPIPSEPSSGAREAPAPATPARRPPKWLEQPEVLLVTVVLGAVVLLGGGMPVGARGVVLALTGAWVFLRPPAITPSRIFEMAVLALLAIGLFSSFAPVAWLRPMAWRADLAQLGVTLPPTNATAPWLAAESFGQLVAGVAWLYACWNLRLTHDSRKQALWGLAWVAALLSAGAVCGNLLHLRYPLGDESVNFSYFQNRNQSALWYCIGGLMAFGLLIEGLRRRRKRFMLAVLLLAPCLLAMAMGRSRMAMALFAVGTLAVMWVRVGRKAGKYILQVIVPLAAVCLVVFLIFTDNDTQRRILPNLNENTAEAPASAWKPDFRFYLWHDTLNLAKTQPAGVGLGQFSQVFPQYRDYSRSYQTVRHPDSDWMWLLGETGWAGLLAMLVAVGALGARFLSKEAQESSSYRNLAAVCAGLFLFSTVVDVPTHRFGTWMLEAWLVGLAAPDAAQPTRTWLPRLGWRLLGALLCGAGLLWLAAQAGLPYNSTLVEERALALSQRGERKMDDAMVFFAAQQGAAIEPMQWWPYFARARAQLTLRNNPNAALANFRVARFLEPTWSRVPYTEGLLWEPTSHAQAFAAWREAIRREDDTPEGLWRNIYDELHNWPDGDEYASVISKTRPLFRWDFLVYEVAPKRLPVEMADELERDPKLAKFTASQRTDILMRWAKYDASAALAYLQNQPRIVAASWKIRMTAESALGHFADALALAHASLPPMPLPTITTNNHLDEESLRSAFTHDPTYLAAGVSLLQRQIDAQDFDGALQTLEIFMKLKKPPVFVSWWRADLLARAGKMEEAWSALQPYLEYELSAAAPQP